MVFGEMRKYRGRECSAPVWLLIIRGFCAGRPGSRYLPPPVPPYRRLSTAIVAALVRVLPSMTFVWFFQLSSIKRSEV